LDQWLLGAISGGAAAALIAITKWLTNGNLSLIRIVALLVLIVGLVILIVASLASSLILIWLGGPVALVGLNTAIRPG
jgi:hypothetical protein